MMMRPGGAIMQIVRDVAATAEKLVDQKGLLPVSFPAALPFRPGTSPFLIKGSYYRELQERLLDWDRIVEAIDDTAVREFGLQRFLATEWYDYLPVIMIARGLGIYFGCPADQAISEQAAKNARRQLSGIYKFVLSFASPEVGMRRMSNVYRQLYNFGRCEISISGDSAVSTYHQWPLMMAWLYQLTTDAWVGTLLGIAGASRVKRTWSAPVPDGTRDGVDLVRLEVRTTWVRRRS
jgi:hypothetical protein